MSLINLLNVVCNFENRCRLEWLLLSEENGCVLAVSPRKFLKKPPPFLPWVVWCARWGVGMVDWFDVCDPSRWGAGIDNIDQYAVGGVREGCKSNRIKIVFVNAISMRREAIAWAALIKFRMAASSLAVEPGKRLNYNSSIPWPHFTCLGRKPSALLRMSVSGNVNIYIWQSDHK